jgi:hypothetical protein
MTIKFSGFTAAATPAPADFIVGLQGGANVKWTVAQLQGLFGASFAANFGDGVSISYVITHNLGSRDVDVTVYRSTTPWDEVICDVAHTSTNSVTLSGFTIPPTTNQFRVKVST